MSKTIQIRVYGKTELAIMYGICWRTLKDRISEFMDTNSDHFNRKKLLSPKEVAQIFEELGVPE